VHALLGEAPASVRSLNPSAPLELERVVGKALEKDRAVRYQSATEILADLKAVGAGLAQLRVGWGLAPAKPAREEPLQGMGAVREPPLHRRRLLVLAAAALLVVVAAAGALRLANDLDKRFPKDTIVQSQYLPMIRAASILGRRPKDGDQAIEALVTAEPYELGAAPTIAFQVYPPYLRGEAYLAAHQGAAAAAEFQKLLDHPGVVLNEPIGALAQLGLGRAYALQAGVGGTAVSTVRNPASLTTGGTPLPRTDALAKARSAYQDFFALWKDADADIPILKQAKAEYAKLQSAVGKKQV